ncbi:MAG: hypothetical protein JXA30_14825 [Deltaproteobacteria bacterium]|nr:hypothetical protein [Deltaproteobacteria bacterium]
MKFALFHPRYWVDALKQPINSSIGLIQVELLTDALVFTYSLWTIACHVTVVSEGTTRYGLSIAAIIALLCFLAVLIALWRIRKWRDAYFKDLRDSPCFAEVSYSTPILLAALAAITLVIATWFITRNQWVVWIEMVIFCSLAILYGTRLASLAAPVAGLEFGRERINYFLLHAAAFICFAFTLLAFRPRTDEGFYASMAVALTNYPDLALNKFAMLHGSATEFLSEQFLFPPYRVHSFELLGGYLGYLTGIESVSIVHLVIAPLFAWFAPFAIARPLKLLIPRYWAMALFIALSFYFIEGSAGRGFANQAFVRFFNGKSVMLTVAVPLLIGYGLRFGAKPTLSRFIFLTCSQITMAGLSSTGIWLAPTLATISVAVAIPTRRALLRTIGLSLLSSSYVLLIGLWVAGQMNVIAVGVAKKATTYKEFRPGFGLLTWVLPNVLGKGWTVIAHLSSVALACAFARRSATLRLFALLGLLLSLVLANPYLVRTVQSYLTGRLTYERIFWLLPIPIALGVWCTDLFILLRKQSRAWIALLFVIVILTTYYVVSTERMVISRANASSIVFPPAVKMWQTDREVAQRVCHYVQNDEYVLAPKGISTQLVTLSHCGIPLISEMRWMGENLSEERRRNRLVAYVSRADLGLDRTEEFFEYLKKYRIAVVVTTKRQYRRPWLRELLAQAGYRKIESIRGFRILIYDEFGPSWTLLRAQRVAKAACNRAPKDGYVLAPFGISRHMVAVKECARPLIDAHSSKSNERLSEKQLHRLDDLVSRPEDLRKREVKWVKSALEAYEVGETVLFNRAFPNERFKALLYELGFIDKGIIDNHLFMLREASAETSPLKQKSHQSDRKR